MKKEKRKINIKYNISQIFTYMRNFLLVKKYPFLKYNGYHYTFYDDIPYGWSKAFGRKLCKELSIAIKKDLGSYDKYEIAQVKEKFGSLRWYDNGGKEVHKITRKYEELSTKTCICCGKPSTKWTTGWIVPVCDKCYDVLERR